MKPKTQSTLIYSPDASVDVISPTVVSRRIFMGALGAAAWLGAPGVLAQQAALLPLNTPGMDHLDVIVPDVEATSRFYMGVFNTTLHAQPFQGGFRYFVLLGELNDKREVGYIAVGDGRERGTYIGHFCTSVFDYRANSEALFAAMKQAFSDQGFGDFAGPTGFGGIFADPDGIEIQMLPAPDTLVTAAVPSALIPANQGLVTPLGLDHVWLHVSDLERATSYYRILYGPEAGRDAANNTVTFHFPATNTRLVLEQAPYQYGSKPHIARFAVKIKPYDMARVTSGIEALGGKVIFTNTADSVLRFTDIDGLTSELVAG